MAENTKGYDTISIEEFNALARQKELWLEGPEIERHDLVYGDPYSPKSEVRGILKDGRRIRSEV